jgi:hypothetical protein
MSETAVGRRSMLDNANITHLHLLVGSLLLCWFPRLDLILTTFQLRFEWLSLCRLYLGRLMGLI